MIIGQDKIINRINNCTLDTFPHTLMLIGYQGSGKHLISKYIADKFNLDYFDITDDISDGLIEEINLRVNPTLYIIDSSKFKRAELCENKILKFLEEPTKATFIVVLVESKMSILPTILNRCQVWELEKYTKETLATFANNPTDMLLEIAKTPGDVIKAERQNVEEMVALANKIFLNITRANFANILTLVDKLDYKGEEPDKFDFNLFVSALIYSIKNIIIKESDVKYLNAYNLTNKMLNDTLIFNVLKQNLYEQYLTQLKVTMNGY